MDEIILYCAKCMQIFPLLFPHREQRIGNSVEVYYHEQLFH